MHAIKQKTCKMFTNCQVMNRLKALVRKL